LFIATQPHEAVENVVRGPDDNEVGEENVHDEENFAGQAAEVEFTEHQHDDDRECGYNAPDPPWQFIVEAIAALNTCSC
jgi:hypothetical protein